MQKHGILAMRATETGLTAPLVSLQPPSIRPVYVTLRMRGRTRRIGKGNARNRTHSFWVSVRRNKKRPHLCHRDQFITPQVFCSMPYAMLPVRAITSVNMKSVFDVSEISPSYELCPLFPHQKELGEPPTYSKYSMWTWHTTDPDDGGKYSLRNIRYLILTRFTIQEYFVSYSRRESFKPYTSWVVFTQKGKSV